MLVIGRKRNEEIVIGRPGEEVVVTVVSVRGNAVRLVVDARASVPVHRREVFDAIVRSGKSLLREEQG